MSDTVKLIIEIPKETYQDVVKNGFIYDEDNEVISYAIIRNSTPLPKGHGRLIDAGEIQFENAEFDTYGDYCIAFDAIDQADTIIEADKGE